MGSPIVVPFNNQPVSTQKGTGTYTCPAGKYARVQISVSGTARTLVTGSRPNAASQGDLDLTCDSFNESFDIWVGPGDTISASLSNPSGSTNVAAGSIQSAASEASATINHNGSPIATFRAVTQGTVGSNSATSFARSGSTSFHFFAQEYNIIS